MWLEDADGIVSEMQIDCLTDNLSKIDDVPIRFDGSINAICTKVRSGSHTIVYAMY